MFFIICYHRLPCCSSYVSLLYHILSYLTVCVYHVLPCFITFYHVFFTMVYHVSNDIRRLPLQIWIPPGHSWQPCAERSSHASLWQQQSCPYLAERGYLVAHPTARKWLITPVINGISRVNPLKSLGL